MGRTARELLGNKHQTVYEEQSHSPVNGAITMVSPTKQSESIRANKRKNAGRKRKNQLETRGTTPTKEEMFKVVDKTA